VKYLVVSNLPFSEVDVPEFRDLLNYTHQGQRPLNIPGAASIKRRVLKLSENTVAEIKSLFEVFFCYLINCRRHSHATYIET
jgi:hypothetical protein